MPELAPHLPVIVEWVDAPERVERLLPRLCELVGRGLITVEDVEIALYRPQGVRDLPVTAAEVMSRDVRSVPPEAPLRNVIELLDGKIYRALPVVEEGRPVGMITNQDLTSRGGLLAGVELLAALPPEERASELSRIEKEGKTAPLMAQRRLKRLPVVDAQGRLVRAVDRVDILRGLVS